MQLYCKPQTYKHDAHAHKTQDRNTILGSYITIKTHNIKIT